jgi:hypothetical protein
MPVKFKSTVCIAQDMSDGTFHVFPDEATARATVWEWIDEFWDDYKGTEARNTQIDEWVETEWKYFTGDFYGEQDKVV